MQNPIHPDPDPQAGFSLAELLVALTLGSILVTSLANGLQLFGTELEQVRDAPDSQLSEAAVQVTEKLRDAWWVEAASATDITLADALGNQSRLRLVNDELRLTRPSGAEGALLSGVNSLSFGVQTTQRLRDATPITVDAPWFARSAPTGSEFELVIKDGDELALAFSMSDDAPDSVDTVPGVHEERLDAALHEIVIKAAFFDANKKVFCHLHASPPHNPTHPGYEGNRLFARLHEARAPDDGRPYGPALGTIEIPVQDLPQASYYWWDTESNASASPPDAENSTPTGTTCSDANADGECDHPGKSKHKDKTDPPGGVAWGWWKNHPNVVHIFDPVAVEVPIPLSQFGLALERGKAYTLVLSVKGWDELRVRGVPLMSSAASGVALKTGGGSFLAQNMVFPFTLQGDQTCTQTQQIDAPSTVTLDIQMNDGRQLSSSASLLSQTSVGDPWFGVVPHQVGSVAP